MPQSAPTAIPAPTQAPATPAVREIAVCLPQSELTPLDELARARSISRSYAIRQSIAAWVKKEKSL